MKQYPAKKIRNIVISGHGGTGKTSLAEAMLFLAKATDRLGKVLDGNTICDFDPEEIKRKASISTSIAPLEWKGNKVNLIDVPGLFDFAGGVYEGFRAAECALITISGKSGVNVGTEKAYAMAQAQNKATVFFVNKLDSESADFYKVFEELKSKFGPSVCPIVVPYVEEHKVLCYINLLEFKAYSYKDGVATEVSMPDMGHRLEGLRTAMYEAVAETTEELMEKYFSGEQFTPEELIIGLATGVRTGAISPVFCGASQTMEGIDHLLNGIEWLVPSPADVPCEIGKDENGGDVELVCKDDALTAAVVFKTVADPFIGKLSYFKVISGKLSSDTPLFNMRTGTSEKIGKTITIRGKKQEDAPYIGAGDIGAVAKLQNANTGDTFCAPARKVTLEGVEFPAPSLSMAIAPKTKGDEEKIASGLARLIEEDPSISYYTNSETHQMILSGQGDQHLDVIVSKLKSKFGVDVVLSIPKVAYRETIRKTVSVQGRHKKQTGGHGQFGDTWIRFEPIEGDEFIFEEEVVGGAVPKGFFPAVEKGLRESIQKGVLAGYPMVGLKAVLYDGSYHPVDSSEMAFKLAANAAYKAGIPTANPVILEPFGSLKAYIPDDKTGDFMGEINKRRGRVLGINPTDSGLQELCAEVPMAEMGDFSTYMRQSTQGRGYYLLNFERYEEAPAHVAQKVIEEAKKRGDID